MWSAVIRRKGIAEPVHLVSPERITVRFLYEIGWLLFTGEFDQHGFPWSEVEDFHIYQEGNLVA